MRGAWDNARLMTTRVLTVASIVVGLLATPTAGLSQPAPELPVVWILATGGTIAGKGATSTSLADYKPGSLRGEDLVAAVPEVSQVARVKVEQIANISSSDITTAHWLTLAARTNALLEDPSLSKFAGRVSDSGEGRWTIKAAIDEAVPVPVLTTALYARFSSRGDADFQNQLLSAMRFQFGGHVEKPKS